MPKRKKSTSRRQYSDEFKAEAVQMLLDGHSAGSVASRLGLSGTSILYRWKSNLMDLYSRRIVAWELRDHMKESLVLAALRSAITLRGPAAALIHHTDRGGQYAGKEYRRVLQRAEMNQSMSRADSCYDNAFMESCFGTIKTELEMTPYKNASIARKEIPEYIRYYNTSRRHSSIGYVSPEAFEHLP